MATHDAVVTVATRAPLETMQLPTVRPGDGEVLIKVQWTASTPLDLHQADGGLLVQPPQVLGDGFAGVVVEVGNGVKKLAVGDQVFGFVWRSNKERAHQAFITTSENLMGKIPTGITPQAAVTVANNFVTVFNSICKDFGLSLPWPKPDNYIPEQADALILIWGGSSSVGQYALQLLHFYGYRNLFATASKRNHELLKSLGATALFDYNDPNMMQALDEAAVAAFKGQCPPGRYVLDCIGSQSGSVAPISKLAQAGTKVSIMLPVIVRDASETTTPEYSMDVSTSAQWTEGVHVVGARTHMYLQNEFFAEHLQPEIMPDLLAKGVITPNKQRLIEGPTLLARAQKALDTLRRKEASAERLVWRVSED